MTKSDVNNNKAILFALFGYFTFSACDGFRKMLSSDYSSMDIFLWVSIINVIATIAFAPMLGGLISAFKTKKLSLHLIRGTIGAACSFFAIKTFTLMPMVEAYTLFFISPFLVSLFSFIFWKERQTIFKTTALASGFIGVLIAMRPGADIIGEGTIYGLLTAFAFSIFLLLGKPLREKETDFSMLFYPSILSVIVALFLVDDINIITDKLDITYFVLGSVPALIGTIFLIKAFNIADAGSVSPTHYSQLIWGFVIGMVAFSEYPDMFVLTGSLIVTMSGILLLAENKVKRYYIRKQIKEAELLAAE